MNDIMTSTKLVWVCMGHGMSFQFFSHLAQFSHVRPSQFFIVERLMRHQPWWDFSRWSGRQFKLIIRRPTMAGRFHGDR